MKRKMILFYHDTRIGNSFNIVLLQEVIWQEFGLSSAYPKGDNFWQLFDENCRPTHGYRGGSDAIEEINAITDPLERLFVKSLLCHPLSEMELHRICTVDQDEKMNFIGSKISIFSVDGKTRIFDKSQIEKRRVTIFNKGHYFSVKDAHLLKMKHQDSLRARLKINISHLSAQTSEFRDFRSSCDQVIAVHLRKTDYASYMGGKFLFNDDEYAEICRTLHRVCEGRVGFVIFSDDDVDMSYFKGLNVIRNYGTAEQDIVAMSMCDCIVGPPSSFGNCASFLGKTRRIILRDLREFQQMYSNEQAYKNRRWFPFVA